MIVGDVFQTIIFFYEEGKELFDVYVVFVFDKVVDIAPAFGNDFCERGFDFGDVLHCDQDAKDFAGVLGLEDAAFVNDGMVIEVVGFGCVVEGDFVGFVEGVDVWVDLLVVGDGFDEEGEEGEVDGWCRLRHDV